MTNTALGHLMNDATTKVEDSTNNTGSSNKKKRVRTTDEVEDAQNQLEGLEHAAEAEKKHTKERESKIKYELLRKVSKT